MSNTTDLELCKPSKSFDFPETSKHFRFAWFEEFPWVCYSPWENRAYCLPCALFGHKNMGKSLQKIISNMGNSSKDIQKTSKCSSGNTKTRQILFHRAWKYPKASIIEFWLFYIQDGGKQVLLNPWEILMKELFFNKVWALQPANTIKTKFTSNSFQQFLSAF